MDKNFYNEASAKKLGWEPSWFGEKYFDDKLVRAVKKWQRSRGISADGLCGPTTFRRLWTERQSEIDDYKPAISTSPTTSFTMVNFSLLSGTSLFYGQRKVELRHRMATIMTILVDPRGALGIL